MEKTCSLFWQRNICLQQNHLYICFSFCLWKCRFSETIRRLTFFWRNQKVWFEKKIPSTWNTGLRKKWIKFVSFFSMHFCNWFECPGCFFNRFFLDLDRNNLFLLQLFDWKKQLLRLLVGVVLDLYPPLFLCFFLVRRPSSLHEHTALKHIPPTHEPLLQSPLTHSPPTHPPLTH